MKLVPLYEVVYEPSNDWKNRTLRVLAHGPGEAIDNFKDWCLNQNIHEPVIKSITLTEKVLVP